MLGILGSRSENEIENADGSKRSSFGLASVGSTVGGEINSINSFKIVSITYLCTSGLRTNGLSAFFWSLTLLSFKLNSSSTK